MTNGIISLTVENIKKIKAVTIRPSGDVVEITGRNGQGKSTDYVRRRAVQEGYQVWEERVSAEGSVGFVIEDGELKQETEVEK